jgi:ubiquinone/menaquinone biosynthesis C-methylase UbiE
MNQKRSSSSDHPFTYFDAQASWGVTKHMGGIDATNELANLCRIDKDDHVLEIGCGTGVTTCYLVKQFGCTVTAVDISDKMVEWAQKRAKRKCIEHMVQFRNADAQNLPFEDNQFDVVLCESVAVFPANKQKVVNEYVRVVKPSGYVGMNEGTWIKPSPPQEMIEFIQRTMAGAKFLPVEEWRMLLENANLVDLAVKTHKVSAFSQRLNEMRGLDKQDRLDRLRGIKDFIMLYIKNPGFRQYAREITPSIGTMKNLFAFLGYGIYVGRKP